jgi:alpha-amylase
LLVYSVLYNIRLQDIAAILAQLNPLPTDQGFPAGSKFYVFHEVIDQNDGAIKVDEYYDMGKRKLKYNNFILLVLRQNLLFLNQGYVTEFRYCQKIGWGIQNYGQLGKKTALSQ